MKCIVIYINERRGSLIFYCPIAPFGEFAKGIILLVVKNTFFQRWSREEFWELSL